METSTKLPPFDWHRDSNFSSDPTSPGKMGFRSGNKKGNVNVARVFEDGVHELRSV